ncbi:MAG: hypothetical protein WKF62_01395, partial [Solirubrobacterales bacterium]
MKVTIRSLYPTNQISDPRLEQDQIAVEIAKADPLTVPLPCDLHSPESLFGCVDRASAPQSKLEGLEAR